LLINLIAKRDKLTSKKTLEIWSRIL